MSFYYSTNPNIQCFLAVYFDETNAAGKTLFKTHMDEISKKLNQDPTTIPIPISMNQNKQNLAG